MIHFIALLFLALGAYHLWGALVAFTSVFFVLLVAPRYAWRDIRRWWRRRHGRDPDDIPYL